MITSFEVGAVINEASPALRKMLKLVKSIGCAILRFVVG
jgi:hypothetical protein